MALTKHQNDLVREYREKFHGDFRMLLKFYPSNFKGIVIALAKDRGLPLEEFVIEAAVRVRNDDEHIEKMKKWELAQETDEVEFEKAEVMPSFMILRNVLPPKEQTKEVKVKPLLHEMLVSGTVALHSLTDRQLVDGVIAMVIKYPFIVETLSHPSRIEVCDEASTQYKNYKMDYFLSEKARPLYLKTLRELITKARELQCT